MFCVCRDEPTIAGFELNCLPFKRQLRSPGNYILPPSSEMLCGLLGSRGFSFLPQSKRHTLPGDEISLLLISMRPRLRHDFLDRRIRAHDSSSCSNPIFLDYNPRPWSGVPVQSQLRRPREERLRAALRDEHVQQLAKVVGIPVDQVLATLAAHLSQAASSAAQPHQIRSQRHLADPSDHEKSARDQLLALLISQTLNS